MRVLADAGAAPKIGVGRTRRREDKVELTEKGVGRV